MTEPERGLSLSARTTAAVAIDVAQAAALGAIASVPVIGPIVRELVGLVHVSCLCAKPTRETSSSLHSETSHKYDSQGLTSWLPLATAW